MQPGIILLIQQVRSGWCREGELGGVPQLVAAVAPVT